MHEGLLELVLQQEVEAARAQQQMTRGDGFEALFFRLVLVVRAAVLVLLVVLFLHASMPPSETKPAHVVDAVALFVVLVAVSFVVAAAVAAA